MSMGRTIDAAVIERGLIELCPDIHLDPTTKKDHWHPYQSVRQGVFWHGQHICSMDRGLVPEFKQWTVVSHLVPVGWEEADKDDVTIQTQLIPSTSSDYLDAMLHVMNRTTGFEMRPDGSILKFWPVATRKTRGRVAMLGWRHTFERIIYRDLPGLTRRDIAEKFSVDMLLYAGVPKAELYAALIEE